VIGCVVVHASREVKGCLWNSFVIRRIKRGQKIQERPFVRACVGVTISDNTSGPERSDLIVRLPMSSIRESKRGFDECRFIRPSRY
jgi:hypothetical protein